PAGVHGSMGRWWRSTVIAPLCSARSPSSWLSISPGWRRTSDSAGRHNRLRRAGELEAAPSRLRRYERALSNSVLARAADPVLLILMFGWARRGLKGWEVRGGETCEGSPGVPGKGAPWLVSPARNPLRAAPPPDPQACGGTVQGWARAVAARSLTLVCTGCAGCADVGCLVWLRVGWFSGLPLNRSGYNFK